MTDRPINNRRIKVAVFNGSERYSGYATGVGKHVKQMVSGLAKRPDFSVNFWVPQDYWALDQQCLATSPLSEVSSSRLPLSRLTLETLTLATGRPRAERFTGVVDWVYSPREVFVNTRQSRSAVTIHDLYHLEADQRSATDLRKLKFRATLTKAAANATLVLTVSKFSAGRICELLSVQPEKIAVVGNGVEQCFFDVSETDPASASPLAKQAYFVSIGGLTSKKGGHSLIDFAKILHRQSKPLKLVVIGPVEPIYASDLRARDNIIVIDGGLLDEEIARWIRGSIATVLLSEYEGFGISALEAMAAGVPVIASARGALPEVVGDAGLVVEPKQMGELENAIDIWKDPSLREEMIKRGRRRAESMQWNHCVDKLAALFRNFEAR